MTTDFVVQYVILTVAEEEKTRVVCMKRKQNSITATVTPLFRTLLAHSKIIKSFTVEYLSMAIEFEYEKLQWPTIKCLKSEFRFQF